MTTHKRIWLIDTPMGALAFAAGSLVTWFETGKIGWGALLWASAWSAFGAALAASYTLWRQRRAFFAAARASALASRGQTDDALTDFNRAIELDRNYTWAIAARGQTYLELNRYDDALADFNRAIKLDRNYTWALGGRGQTYRRLKRYDDALADFNRAIELDRNYTWAIAARSQTYAAMGAV
jgi:tetratricopeptide (TPR) repeat protein